MPRSVRGKPGVGGREDRGGVRASVTGDAVGERTQSGGQSARLPANGVFIRCDGARHTWWKEPAVSVDHERSTPDTARGSALQRDAAIAAARLRAALDRHGLLTDDRAFPELRGSLNNQGRPVVTLGQISPDTALALADLLDGIRPAGI
jgi:hypothetical protein